MESKPNTTIPVPKAALRWIAGHAKHVVAFSAKIIWAHMVGVDLPPSRVDGPPRHPVTPGDFASCMSLFEAVPEWRARIAEMGIVSPQWKTLAEHWDELEMLWNAESDSPAWTLRMRELLAPFRVAQRQ